MKTKFYYYKFTNFNNFAKTWKIETKKKKDKSSCNDKKPK